MTSREWSASPTEPARIASLIASSLASRASASLAGNADVTISTASGRAARICWNSAIASARSRAGENPQSLRPPVTATTSGRQVRTSLRTRPRYGTRPGKRAPRAR
jgi:hypothetical protein